MSKGLLLIGAGGHAEACIEVIESARLKVYGLIDRPDRVGQTVLGYPILGTDDDVPRLAAESDGALVTVGQIRSPELRIALYERLVELGLARPVIVAASGCVSRHACIGAGTIVMHGAIVNAGARVLENAIINSQALIEHDAEISDHCHVSTGAIVNGGARIGRASFIGSGAVIGEGVSIGANSVIGAGNILLGDQPANTVIKGGTWPTRS